jgi:hypothetical protein
MPDVGEAASHSPNSGPDARMDDFVSRRLGQASGIGLVQRGSDARKDAAALHLDDDRFMMLKTAALLNSH